MTDGLQERHRVTIRTVLASNYRVERVVLFGSRAMGTFRPSSDIDLLLFGRDLTLLDQLRLTSAMEELTVPQTVDLLLQKNVEDDRLRVHIEKHGIEWYRRPADAGRNQLPASDET